MKIVQKNNLRFLFIFSYPHKANTKNKNKHFNSHVQEKIYSKKGNLFDLHVSLNEEELQKVKSVQTESVFLMILVKFINRKYS